MKSLRGLWLAALLPLLASVAGAGDQAIDAPRLSPQAASGVSASGSAPQVIAGPSLVPDIPATLAPADAPRPEARAEAADVLAAPRATFGRRAAPPTLPPSLPADALGAQGAPSLVPASGPDGGRSGNRLVQRVREEAAKLGVTGFEEPPDEAVSALASMRTEGFSIVSAGALVTAADVAAINAEIDSYEKDRPRMITTWSLYGNDKPGEWDAHELRRWQPKNGGASKPVIDRIRALLSGALDEDIELRDASMRIGYADLENPHVDGGGYITVTVTLQGPGTLIYRIERDGRVEELEAPIGAAAFVTNTERQQAMGIPGTVHSSPTPDHYRGHPAGVQRRLLILRFKRRDLPKLTDEQRQTLTAANSRAVRRALEYRARKAQ